MKTVEVFCDHDNNSVEVHILRINKKTGAFQRKRRVVHRGTPTERRYARVLQEHDSEYCKSSDGRYCVKTNIKEITIKNQCLMCEWYLGVKSCLAFPKAGSIPENIWDNKYIHTKPHPGDHGVRFEKI